MGASYGRMNFANMPRFSLSSSNGLALNNSTAQVAQCNPSKARPECRTVCQFARYLSTLTQQAGSVPALTNGENNNNNSGQAESNGLASEQTTGRRRAGGRRRRQSSRTNGSIMRNNRSTLRRSARLGGASLRGAASSSVGGSSSLGQPEQIQSTLRRSARIAGVRGGPLRRPAAARRQAGSGGGARGSSRPSRARRSRSASDADHQRELAAEGAIRRSLRLAQRSQQAQLC